MSKKKLNCVVESNFCTPFSYISLFHFFPALCHAPLIENVCILMQQKKQFFHWIIVFTFDINLIESHLLQNMTAFVPYVNLTEIANIHLDIKQVML